MPALYIHVPFCLSRCVYCDFYVVLAKYGGVSVYVEALTREIHQRFEAMTDQPPLKTLYIGGGTPSLLAAQDYQRILTALRQYWRFAPEAEITLEANPQGMTDPPEAYRAVGFNRLSIGIQSLQDGELKKLSRLHSAPEAMAFVQATQAVGFDNLSVDLMYGIPGQTRESWRDTLNGVVDLGVQHVSMYGLKVEDTTPLHRLARYAAYALPEEDDTVAMYFDGVETLEAAGLHQYEFSNFAQPGRESRHNLNYWDNGPFYALGPGAHGYDGHQRYENVRDLATYLQNPLAGEIIPCSAQERLENALIFGLRKTAGVSIPALEAEYHINFQARYGAILEKYAEFFAYDGQTLRLTRDAIPVSNTLLAEFLS